MIILQQEILEDIVKFIRARHKTIVFTSGCFDILHDEHVKLLEFCKQNGDNVIVGLTRESEYNIQSVQTRALVLDSIKYINHVYVFSKYDYGNTLDIIKPNILVSRDNINSKLNNVGEIRVFPKLNGNSTGSIIDKILKKYNMSFL